MSSFTLIRRPPLAAVDFPDAELGFGRDGACAEPGQVAAIRAEFATAGVTDLLVLCGGWADRDSGLRALYDGLATAVMTAVRRDPALGAHTYGIVRVMWPSRRWPEAMKAPLSGTLTTDERTHREIAALEMEVTSLRGAFSGRQADRHLLKVWQLISSASESVPAQVSLVEHLRELVRGTDEMNPIPRPNEYASRQFLAMHPIRLLEAVSDPAERDGRPAYAPAVPADDESYDETAAPAEAPADCDLYQGIRNLLAYAVSSEMRTRAETLGRIGLRDCLLELTRGLPQTRMHLIGHSYGARAILSAVDAPSESAKLIRPKSLTLLQPALPQDAFAPASDGQEEGFFHSVLAEGKAGGPILVSYSTSDETAGVPYAISCRIAEHSQQGKLPYPKPVGAMGQHGAVGSGAQTVSLAGRALPHWRRGMLVNLDGSGIIANHTDVCGTQVAQTFLSAATTTT